MKEREIVSDTGPLISLERLPDGYQWMQELYAGIILPPSVTEELLAGGYEDLAAYEQHFGIDSLLQNLFCGLSTTCDFVDLAQRDFCISPGSSATRLI